MFPRPVFVGVLVTLAAVVPPLAGAETTEILATGPDRGRGIPYLQANVIEYYVATYRTASEAAPATNGPPGASGVPAGGRAQPESHRDAVEVLYTDVPIVPYDDWTASGCGGLKTLSVAGEPRVVFFHDQSGWSLFFAFPESAKNPCAFVAAFVDRFNYFLGITRNSALSSFPAILKVSGS